MRIAIVNDLGMAVEVLRRVVVSDPAHRVVWTAANGAEAVEKCARDTPDVILMDLIMPVMDGVQATKAIMQRSPCAILVVTATVAGNAAKVFEAMSFGALDAIGTPVFAAHGEIGGAKELLKKIATIGTLIASEAPAATAPEATPASGAACPMIAIGSSTGGPMALVSVLAPLPRDLRASVVIVQHVDVQFAAGLAEWLDEQTELSVVLAREGEPPAAGKVYLAATNDHLTLGADLAFRYTREPASYPYRPSVDTFFSSLVRHWPRRDTAVLLTGMGKDGAQGLLEMRQAGWHTIAQDEATSLVYGMPRAAKQIGAAAAVLPLESIGAAVLEHIRKRES
jgi:two-component system, chemotaxis family, response regulator WspF